MPSKIINRTWAWGRRRKPEGKTWIWFRNVSSEVYRTLRWIPRLESKAEFSLVKTEAMKKMI